MNFRSLKFMGIISYVITNKLHFIYLKKKVNYDLFINYSKDSYWIIAEIAPIAGVKTEIT